MPMGNQNGVVMGFPAGHLETSPCYEELTIVTATPQPSSFDKLDEKLNPCVKLLILTFLVIFLLFLFLAFSGVYLTYQTRVPIIQIESITPYIASSNNATIFTNWHLTFSLKNPARYAAIHYTKIQVSVSDKDKRRSSSFVDYFYQDKREEGRMNVDVFGLLMDLEKQKVNDAGEMVFSVKLDAQVWLETNMKNRRRWLLLEANCGYVKIQPSMSLRLDGSGRCNVNFQ